MVGAKKSVTLLASAARTATPTADSLTRNDPNALGVHVIVDVTASAATPSVVVTIEGQDPASGKWYALLTSAAFTGSTETRVLKVYPGITVAANLSAADVLPASWRVVLTHADADSITYSVGANIIS